jgi:hypothetical protein
MPFSQWETVRSQIRVGLALPFWSVAMNGLNYLSTCRAGVDGVRGLRRAVATLVSLGALFGFVMKSASASSYYISPHGDDSNLGPARPIPGEPLPELTRPPFGLETL